MKRRDFIKLIAGTAAAWPLGASAQQGERVRRIGVQMNLASDDQEGQARIAAFQQGLQELGWSVDRNVRIDYRWGGGEERFRKNAAELVALAPDVILAVTSTVTAALQRESRAVPIVFVGAVDPVGLGVVGSLARPGGNATGFTVFEYGISPKWLELLKEIAPQTSHVGIIRDPTSTGQLGLLGGIQSAAATFALELRMIDVRDAVEIERALAALARYSQAGLIVQSGSRAFIHREIIVSLASRHRLPAVYSDRVFVTGGGLVSYGPDRVDQYRRAAGYVDRILKGEKPADLPVQAPTKYELVINLKAARGLGLEVPPTLLARADEVIE
jgi:putative tryptophan/tyrosine transport system substrate-binding protein